MTTTGTISWNEANYQRQIDELKQLASKRFWELYWDESLRWWGVRDSWGKIICQPRPESQLRGFFAGLNAQA